MSAQLEDSNETKEPVKASASNVFDLKYVHENFSACLLDDDIALDKYLNAYKELQKFCHLMGTVFGFVGSEIGSKMEILEEFRMKDQAGNFLTMKKMVQYEVENNLLKDSSSYVSGSRTLLRLHRGLDFLRQFLQKVWELSPEDKTHHIGQEVYKETLAKYHSWIIRKGALLAMCVLPTREVLLNRVCGEYAQSALESLPDMLKSTNDVYNRTEDYYTRMGLQSLP